MKLGRITVLAASACFAVLTTGCATVTGGTTQTMSVKTQKNTVDVAGADCVLSNSRGTYTVTTPGNVTVHRAKDDLSVSCTREGEAPALTSVKSSNRGGAMAANIVMFGIGAVVTHAIDKATGGAYAYPDDITVAFGKDDEPRGTASIGSTSTGSPQSANAQAEATR
ncbi:hypothetical protein EXE55_07025 [Burkholderia glumae]|uniref:hypothetical protein n=1 Tax=Burkholderia glumae TaxID=337 RepID=UPI001373DCF5|nr:hypothetical protein [Burkholderia glumae]QHP90702.1 hypothetical protein EXE55_07025 [Burkholderia glumae]